MNIVDKPYWVVEKNSNGLKGHWWFVSEHKTEIAAKLRAVKEAKDCLTRVIKQELVVVVDMRGK